MDRRLPLTLDLTSTHRREGVNNCAWLIHLGCSPLISKSTSLFESEFTWHQNFMSSFFPLTMLEWFNLTQLYLGRVRSRRKSVLESTLGFSCIIVWTFLQWRWRFNSECWGINCDTDRNFTIIYVVNCSVGSHRNSVCFYASWILQTVIHFSTHHETVKRFYFCGNQVKYCMPMIKHQETEEQSKIIGKIINWVKCFGNNCLKRIICVDDVIKKLYTYCGYYTGKPWLVRKAVHCGIQFWLILRSAENNRRTTSGSRTWSGRRSSEAPDARWLVPSHHPGHHRRDRKLRSLSRVTSQFPCRTECCIYRT